MQVARFKDGTSVRFDEMQAHGDKVLFFRKPIGLVHAKQKDELESIEDADSSKAGGNTNAA